MILHKRRLWFLWQISCLLIISQGKLIVIANLDKTNPTTLFARIKSFFLREWHDVLNYEGVHARKKGLFLDDLALNDALMAW